MRTLLIAAFLALFATGCASKQKAPYHEKKQGRDYSSMNRESLSFLFGTFRQDRELRREGRKHVWRPGERRRENAQVQKESVAFLWEALRAGEADSWKYAWTELFPELLRGPEDFGASVRFGALDTGE